MPHVAGRPAGHLPQVLPIVLPVLLLAATGYGALAQRDTRSHTTVCFVEYPPYVVLDRDYDRSILAQLHRQELDLVEFNQYFSGRDVELATALATAFLQQEPWGNNVTKFKLAHSEDATGTKFYEALHWTRTGECDLGIGGFFSTTPRIQCDCPLTQPGEPHTGEQTCCLDFSQPYGRDGFSIVTKMISKESAFVSNVAANLNLSSLTLVCLLVLAIYVSGHIVWLVERHSNPRMFPPGYLDGVDDGMWWSVSTMTTVGYGDKVPITALGRCLGFTWMIIGLIIFGVFNAVLTSALTSSSVESFVLQPQDVSHLKQLFNSPHLFPICTLPYQRNVLVGYGLNPDDVRVAENITTCYQLLNASSSPPTRSNHIGSLIFDRTALIIDSLPEVHRLYHSLSLQPDASGTAPLTTIFPGVVVNPVLETSRIAVAFPKGSPLLDKVNSALRQLEDGFTVYSSVAAAYNGGWTLEESENRHLGQFTSPYQAVRVDSQNFPTRQALTSKYGDIGVIALTLAVTVIFFTVQVVGHRRTLFKYPSLKVHAADTEHAHLTDTACEGKGCEHAAISKKLEADVAELRKTIQQMVQAQTQMDSRLAALAPGGSAASLHLPPLNVPPSSRPP